MRKREGESEESGKVERTGSEAGPRNWESGNWKGEELEGGGDFLPGLAKCKGAITLIQRRMGLLPWR